MEAILQNEDFSLLLFQKELSWSCEIWDSHSPLYTLTRIPLDQQIYPGLWEWTVTLSL